MDLLASILNHLDEALIIADNRGRVLLSNEPAAMLSKDLFGRPFAAGELLADLVDVSQRDFINASLIRVQAEKKRDKSFAEYLAPGGTRYYLEFDYLPVIDDNGELRYINLFIRDLTPQKVFEKRLSAQAANINNLIEKANAIIIGVDTRGYITDWNEFSTRTTGYEKDEVYSRKFADMLLAEEKRSAFDDLIQRIRNHESIYNYEVPAHTLDGREIMFLLNGTPRTNTSGEVIGITFVGQDVTELSEYRRSLEMKVEERTHELKQALKKEQEVVEMKSRFVSIASHEFRTPLSSIQHSARFMKSNHSLSDMLDIQDKLDNIEKNALHMTRLLDDVLTYGKNEAGKVQLVLSRVVVKDFITRITEGVMEGTRNTHVIETQLRMPTEILTDDKLLRSILTNLLTNAIKFSPGKTRVFLEAREFLNHFIITVRDEGIGIPPDEVDKIFEPFLRGKGTDAIAGTGLGLSIVKKSVELLGGTLQVASRVNEGTTFTITIPRLEK